LKPYTPIEGDWDLGTGSSDRCSRGCVPDCPSILSLYVSGSEF